MVRRNAHGKQPTKLRTPIDRSTFDRARPRPQRITGKSPLFPLFFFSIARRIRYSRIIRVILGGHGRKISPI